MWLHQIFLHIVVIFVLKLVFWQMFLQIHFKRMYLSIITHLLFLYIFRSFLTTDFVCCHIVGLLFQCSREALLWMSRQIWWLCKACQCGGGRLSWGEFWWWFGDVKGWQVSNCGVFFKNSMFHSICTWFNYVLLFCGYIISTLGFIWYVYPHPSGLLHWHWGNHMIAPVLVK